LASGRAAYHSSIFGPLFTLDGVSSGDVGNADLILVLDQGKIIERGTHDSLLRRNGYYAHLIQSQLETGEIKSL